MCFLYILEHTHPECNHKLLSRDGCDDHNLYICTDDVTLECAKVDYTSQKCDMCLCRDQFQYGLTLQQTIEEQNSWRDELIKCSADFLDGKLEAGRIIELAAARLNANLARKIHETMKINAERVQKLAAEFEEEFKVTEETLAKQAQESKANLAKEESWTAKEKENYEEFKDIYGMKRTPAQELQAGIRFKNKLSKDVKHDDKSSSAKGPGKLTFKVSPGYLERRNKRTLEVAGLDEANSDDPFDQVKLTKRRVPFANGYRRV